jgi:hypothetical protein
LMLRLFVKNPFLVRNFQIGSCCDLRHEPAHECHRRIE